MTAVAIILALTVAGMTWSAIRLGLLLPDDDEKAVADFNRWRNAMQRATGSRRRR